MTGQIIRTEDMGSRQWRLIMIDGETHIVAGADSAEEALALMEAARQPPPLSGADVSLERDRRISRGQTVTTAAGLTLTVQTRNEGDLLNLNGLVTRAMLMLSLGQAGTITFRDQDNVDHTLTPQQMIEVGSLVAAKIDALYKRSWALKDTAGGIPADYQDDRYWT